MQKIRMIAFTQELVSLINDIAGLTFDTEDIKGFTLNGMTYYNMKFKEEIA